MATPTPQPTSWIPSAPVQISQRAIIGAPPSVVWAELANNEGWVDWFPGCKECHFIGDEPHGLDSSRFVHMDQFKVKERIIAWKPEKRWGLTVLEINAPIIAAMAEEATLTEVDGGTQIDFKIGVELTRFGRLLKGPLVAKQTKSIEKALKQLGERCTG